MKAYSLDIRERVIHSRESIRKSATRYQVSTNFIVRLRQRYRATGQLTPKPRGGNRRPRVDRAGGVWLTALLHREPSVTLAELCSRYETVHGVSVSKSSMDRTLKRLGMSYKKTPVDPQRHTERVQHLTAAYEAQLAGVEASQLVFLDEAGACLNLTVEYGRSPRGQRVSGETPTAKGRRISTVGALSCQGLETAFCYEGTLNAEVFLYLLIHFRVPSLRPGQVVVVDNAAAHRDARVAALIQAAGARVVYLPPYSPHLNPIELAWAKLKHHLRKAAARTGEALYQAWAEALQTLSSSHARGFFQHVGICALS